MEINLIAQFGISTTMFLFGDKEVSGRLFQSFELILKIERLFFTPYRCIQLAIPNNTPGCKKTSFLIPDSPKAIPEKLVKNQAGRKQIALFPDAVLRLG